VYSECTVSDSHRGVALWREEQGSVPPRALRCSTTWAHPVRRSPTAPIVTVVLPARFSRRAAWCCSPGSSSSPPPPPACRSSCLLVCRTPSWLRVRVRVRVASHLNPNPNPSPSRQSPSAAFPASPAAFRLVCPNQLQMAMISERLDRPNLETSASSSGSHLDLTHTANEVELAALEL